MKQKPLVLWLITLLGILLAACDSSVIRLSTSETPIATSTQQPTRSHTQLPSSTSRLTPSPTSISTATPTKTLYPTHTPTISPTPLHLVTPPAGLYYSLGNVLWRVDKNNVPQKLWESPAQSYFIVSPDGGRVLDYYNRIVFDFSTHKETYLSLGKDYSTGYPQWWEANPHLILVEAEPTEEMGSSPRGITMPAIINLLDGSYALLANETYSWGFSDPSPNGKAVAYDIRCVPWIYTWEKGAQVFNVELFGYSPKVDVCITHPAWSPSGHYLAWIISSDEESGEGWGIGSVGIFDMVNGRAKILRDYTVEGYDGGRSFLYWSPDEKYIVLDNFGNHLLGVIPIDGSTAAILVSGVYPTWNPAGQWLAYQADGKIWVLTVEDHKSYPVGKGYEPFWSPDGNWLVLSDEERDLVTQTGSWELQRLDLPVGANIVGWLPIY